MASRNSGVEKIATLFLREFRVYVEQVLDDLESFDNTESLLDDDKKAQTTGWTRVVLTSNAD